MTITKEQLKAEIDNVREEDLGVLYRIVLALEATPSSAAAPGQAETDFDAEEWRAFVARTYGSCADSPIERGDQGIAEVREDFR